MKCIQHWHLAAKAERVFTRNDWSGTVISPDMFRRRTDLTVSQRRRRQQYTPRNLAPGFYSSSPYYLSTCWHAARSGYGGTWKTETFWSWSRIFINTGTWTSTSPTESGRGGRYTWLASCETTLCFGCCSDTVPTFSGRTVKATRRYTQPQTVLWNTANQVCKVCCCGDFYVALWHAPCVEICRRVFSAYEDLVVPLIKNCPQALKTPNNAGVTPEDLLNWMEREDEVVSLKTAFCCCCCCSIVCAST